MGESKNMETESLAVQKANWVLEEVERQRKIEDEIRIKLLEEQKLLEERAKSIEDGMDRSAQLRYYNEQRREELNAQVYALYGLSNDKLKGIKQYKSGLFRGCAAILFLLSLALAGVCAYLYGPLERITIVMAALVASEAALIPRDSLKVPFLHSICKILYVAIFPVMMWVFVSYEFHFIEHELILLGVIIAVGVMSILGSIAYFVHNPYAQDRSGIRNARRDLAALDKIAEKQVKKNQRLRKKKEKKDLILQNRMQEKQEKENRHNEKQEAKEKKKEAIRSAREEKWNSFKKKFHREKTQKVLPVMAEEVAVVSEEVTAEGMQKEPGIKEGQEAVIKETSIKEEVSKETKASEVEAKEEAIEQEEKTDSIQEKTEEIEIEEIKTEEIETEEIKTEEIKDSNKTSKKSRNLIPLFKKKEDIV